jgi:hypothetical protein
MAEDTTGGIDQADDIENLHYRTGLDWAITIRNNIK